MGSISFQPTTLYATGKNKTTIFWLPLTSDWLDAASQLEVIFFSFNFFHLISDYESFHIERKIDFNLHLLYMQNLELEQCISKDKCLPKAPVIVNGLRASTSDIYLQNKAYREFIYTQFKASTVDTQSAAVALVR